MSTSELNGIKLNLISWINQLTNKEIISFLEELRLSRAKEDWRDELSDVQQKQISLPRKWM